MAKKAPKSKGTIKCPMCDLQFLPQFYHLEKIKYELEIPNGRKLFNIFKKSHNSKLKPSNIIRRAWITSCPECGFIIRFAAEIGKKELLETPKSKLHRKEFKEQEKTYQYIFYTLDKPFKESRHYSEELNEEIQKKIIYSLENIDLRVWGNLYKTWKKKERIDSFKFLIRYLSIFEKYYEQVSDESGEHEILQKLEALHLPEPLKNLVLKVFALRNISINNNYDLNENDEVLILESYIKLLHFLVLQNLVPLKLNKINLQGNYDLLDQKYYFLKLKEFLHNYLFDLLGIKKFEEVFFNPLLESLKIPIDTYNA